MTYADYWILDAVVEGRYPLSTLREDVVENAFNRKGHGLTRPQFVTALSRLFSNGDIYASYEDGLEQHSLSTAEIKNTLVSPRWIWYGLTDQGGRKWEAITKPTWERFITGGLDAEANDCDVASCSRTAVSNYLEGSAVSGRIVPGSVVWSEIVGWGATYWKRLPTGFEVHFRITHPDTDFMVAQPPDDWYLHPFT